MQSETLFATASDGVRIAYEIAGDGSPIVLIHGFASSREQNWRSTGWYARLTGAGFRVIALDLRGHGQSDKPHEPSAYGAMAGDIRCVMDAAGVHEANLLGYSMGGMLAIRMLMEHPERVGRVIVAGVGANYFSEEPWRLRVAAALETENGAAVTDPTVRRFRVFASQKGKDPLALAACLRAPRRIYPPEALKRSTHPVLVVCGENDDISGPPEPLAAAFADGRAVRLPGRDHMSAVGDKGAKDAVLEFLEQCASPASGKS